MTASLFPPVVTQPPNGPHALVQALVASGGPFSDKRRVRPWIAMEHHYVRVRGDMGGPDEVEWPARQAMALEADTPSRRPIRHALSPECMRQEGLGIAVEVDPVLGWCGVVEIEHDAKRSYLEAEHARVPHHAPGVSPVVDDAEFAGVLKERIERPHDHDVEIEIKRRSSKPSKFPLIKHEFSPREIAPRMIDTKLRDRHTLDFPSGLPFHHQSGRRSGTAAEGSGRPCRRDG